MTTYTPDCWVILKLQSKKHGIVYKILAGWYGGYLNGDSWKLNSGITKVIKHKHYYEFFGSSGSVYKCHKETERMSGLTSDMYMSFKNQETDDIKIDIIEYKDFKKEFKDETTGTP